MKVLLFLFIIFISTSNAVIIKSKKNDSTLNESDYITLNEIDEKKVSNIQEIKDLNDFFDTYEISLFQFALEDSLKYLNLNYFVNEIENPEEEKTKIKNISEIENILNSNLNLKILIKNKEIIKKCLNFNLYVLQEERFEFSTERHILYSIENRMKDIEYLINKLDKISIVMLEKEKETK